VASRLAQGEAQAVKLGIREAQRSGGPRRGPGERQVIDAAGMEGAGSCAQSSAGGERRTIVRKEKPAARSGKDQAAGWLVAAENVASARVPVSACP